MFIAAVAVAPRMNPGMVITWVELLPVVHLRRRSICGK